jgi:hypothetical protein
MAQVNEQLQHQCELLQSQKPTLAAYRAPRRIVSLSISPGNVKDWTPADALVNCIKISTCRPLL